MKRKGLIVSQPVPIYFSVDLLTGADKQVVGDAATMIKGALTDWLSTLEALALLADSNPEGKALRTILMS